MTGFIDVCTVTKIDKTVRTFLLRRLQAFAMTALSRRAVVVVLGGCMHDFQNPDTTFEVTIIDATLDPTEALHLLKTYIRSHQYNILSMVEILSGAKVYFVYNQFITAPHPSLQRLCDKAYGQHHN